MSSYRWFYHLGFTLLISFMGINAFAQFEEVVANEYEFKDSLFLNAPGKYQFIWRARVYGENTALETQDAQVAGMDLFLEGKYQLIESLALRISLRPKFESGRSQSFFGDIEPANGILLREATVEYKPIEEVQIRAGVINQDWMNMPLLTFRQAFPGAKVNLSLPVFEGAEVGAISQYTIPSSQTLSTRTTGPEKTPSLVTHSAYFAYQKSGLSTGVRGSLFEYENLPSFVAFESQKYGNTLSDNVIGGPNNSAFKYSFKGWFTQTELKYRINRFFEPHIYWDIIKNNNAPDTYNDGQNITIGTYIHTNNYRYSIGYENFFIESDAVPGFYNSWGYGHTNKKGQGIEMRMFFLKYNFRITAQYYEAKVLNLDPLQQDQQYFYLGLETGYDTI